MLVYAVSITLTQLRSFLAVVRGGSVTAAADELVVTQPSVSAAVTALSREVGTRLLERDGRGVRPTAAGREFAAYAADVLGLLEQGRRAAREAAAGNAHALTIAAVTTAAESFVPPLMRAFAARASAGRADARGRQPGRPCSRSCSATRPTSRSAGAHRPTRGSTPHAIAANEMVLITAADDPLAGRRHGRAGRARVATLAPARAGLGHAHGQRGVPRRHGHRRRRR